jgi:hypothetical protein
VSDFSVDRTSCHYHPLGELLGVSCEGIELNFSGENSFAMDFMSRDAHAMTERLELKSETDKREYVAVSTTDDDTHVQILGCRKFREHRPSLEVDD